MQPRAMRAAVCIAFLAACGDEGGAASPAPRDAGNDTALDAVHDAARDTLPDTPTDSTVSTD